MVKIVNYFHTTRNIFTDGKFLRIRILLTCWSLSGSLVSLSHTYNSTLKSNLCSNGYNVADFGSALGRHVSSSPSAGRPDWGFPVYFLFHQANIGILSHQRAVIFPTPSRKSYQRETIQTMPWLHLSSWMKLNTAYWNEGKKSNGTNWVTECCTQTICKDL